MLPPKSKYDCSLSLSHSNSVLRNGTAPYMTRQVLVPPFVLRPQRRTTARCDTAPTYDFTAMRLLLRPSTRAYRALLDFAFGSPCLVEGSFLRATVYADQPLQR